MSRRVWRPCGRSRGGRGCFVGEGVPSTRWKGIDRDGFRMGVLGGKLE